MKSSTRLIMGFLFILGIVLLMVISLEGAIGETIIVAKKGSRDYDNINDAVDAATDGDTILVKEGTYKENVVIENSITLIGNGSANTIIQGSGSGNVVGIYSDWVNISGFKIIESGPESSQGAGIKVNANHNKVFNNTLQENGNGIYVFRSQSNTINNNICSNNFVGICLGLSGNNIIENNTMSDNYRGIYISGDYNFINNNTCIINQFAGIVLAGSHDTTLTRNIFVRNGITIQGANEMYWDSHEIDTSNTVNGRPIYYYKNASGITIPAGAGQVILSNCTKMIIENQNLSFSFIGLSLGYSDNNTISLNTFSNNLQYGVSLWYSDDNSITDNNFTNNNYGMSIGWSDHNTIKRNTFTGNDFCAINIGSGSDNIVTNNHFDDNTADIYGDYIEKEENGDNGEFNLLMCCFIFVIICAGIGVFVWKKRQSSLHQSIGSAKSTLVSPYNPPAKSVPVPDVVFPVEGSCSGCNAKLKIRKPGRIMCPICKTYAMVNEQGQFLADSGKGVKGGGE